jgi:NAD(P)-dependent dehydrogenase (short-subunit alcohol dehydrogenase family)
MAVERELSGRRALVTGAGQGVGRGIAQGLAAAGAHVVVNDLVADRAQEVVDEIAAAGGGASVAAFDVTDHAAVRAAVEAGGPVDVLVNNAGNAGVEGVGTRKPFAETEPHEWEPFLQVNLYGVLHGARAVLPGMIERGWGRVITIVSDAGRTGDKLMAPYAAAKAGAAGFTRALALEGGRHGVTANCISLGTMRTPLTEAFWAEPNPMADALMQRYVVRRPGGPDDVAPLVVLLASDAGEWITGQTYPVNGGYSFGL